MGLTEYSIVLDQFHSEIFVIKNKNKIKLQFEKKNTQLFKI